MDDIFEIIVHYGTNVLELGHCDRDHVSLIRILHVGKEMHSEDLDPLKEVYTVCVQLHWSYEVREVHNDIQLLDVFELFRRHNTYRIVFEVERTPYVPLPPEGSSSTPNVNDGVLDVDEVKSLSDLHEDGLDGLDDILFSDGGGNGDSKGNRVEEEFDDEVIEMNVGEEYENVKLMEVYESNDDDVFYSDSEDESPEARISRMVRG
ncbi:hypothetical protein ACOSQ2_002933 [Xanthoceras sorbifolium]